MGGGNVKIQCSLSNQQTIEKQWTWFIYKIDLNYTSNVSIFKIKFKSIHSMDSNVHSVNKGVHGVDVHGVDKKSDFEF